MAHSETEIRQAILPLLTVYGELNTTQVKKLLNRVLEFDEDDKIKSQTRKEILIMQRIGNIVAHQDKDKKLYSEGFIVDKSVKPALFILHNPISGKTLNFDEIRKMRRKKKTFKSVAKRVDWKYVRDRNNEIGDQGEEFVIGYEANRLSELLLIDGKQYVRHLTRLQGDGLGYDISSINEDGSVRYIEVKTTSGKRNSPFYMSRNELAFFNAYKDQAFIYRVYNFNLETRRGQVKIISQKELFDNYIFDPITYKVSHK
jgi:hypothetical protein